MPEREQRNTKDNALEDFIPEIDVFLGETDVMEQSIGESAFNTLPLTNAPMAAPSLNMIPEAISGTSDFAPSMSFGLDDNFSWEMIGLGLEEPLPTQEAIDELYVV